MDFQISFLQRFCYHFPLLHFHTSYEAVILSQDLCLVLKNFKYFYLFCFSLPLALPTPSCVCVCACICTHAHMCISPVKFQLWFLGWPNKKSHSFPGQSWISVPCSSKSTHMEGRMQLSSQVSLSTLPRALVIKLASPEMSSRPS